MKAKMRTALGAAGIILGRVGVDVGRADGALRQEARDLLLVEHRLRVQHTALPAIEEVDDVKLARDVSNIVETARVVLQLGNVI